MFQHSEFYWNTEISVNFTEFPNLVGVTTLGHYDTTTTAHFNISIMLLYKLYLYDTEHKREKSRHSLIRAFQCSQFSMSQWAHVLTPVHTSIHISNILVSNPSPHFFTLHSLCNNLLDSSVEDTWRQSSFNCKSVCICIPTQGRDFHLRKTFLYPQNVYCCVHARNENNYTESLFECSCHPQYDGQQTHVYHQMPTPHHHQAAVSAITKTTQNQSHRQSLAPLPQQRQQLLHQQLHAHHLCYQHQHHPTHNLHDNNYSVVQPSHQQTRERPLSPPRSHYSN